MQKRENPIKKVVTKIKEIFVKPKDNSTEREKIAKRAQEIYEKSGRKEGQSEQNWLQAEREIRKRK
ncbi:DUF2934 domain-containing protein [Chlamydiota bacterium]